MQQLRENEENKAETKTTDCLSVMTQGENVYRLRQRITEDKTVMYSVEVSGRGIIRALEDFTSEEEVARAFFRLLYEYEVSPYHLKDIWDDFDKR